MPGVGLMTEIEAKSRGFAESIVGDGGRVSVGECALQFCFGSAGSVVTSVVVPGEHAGASAVIAKLKSNLG